VATGRFCFVFVLVTSRILENVHPDLVAAGRHAKASRSSAILSRRFPGVAFLLLFSLHAFAFALSLFTLSVNFSHCPHLKGRGEIATSPSLSASHEEGMGDISASDLKNPLSALQSRDTKEDMQS
jgi:hypothetical protein